MLKKRIAACLPLYNGIVVQSIGFKKYLPVGTPQVALEYLNKWGIDEIILIDITSRRKGIAPDFAVYKDSSAKCQVPLTIGGGINFMSDVEQLMHCGADKVSLNRALFDKPELITEIAKVYGDQCAVVSVDSIKDKNGERKAYNYLTRSAEKLSVKDAVLRAVDLGAGEIFLNAVDHDGMYNGYDVEMIAEICECVHVPVIAAGGARNANDMITLIRNSGVSAACAGNFFHFTEHSVNIAKRVLVNSGVEVRLETHADYSENMIDSQQRLIKKTDEELDNLLYLKVEKEII